MKKLKFLDRMVYYSIGFVSIYTIFVTGVWALTQVEPPSVLTEWVYKFWGFEVFMTAVITLYKIKRGGSQP